MAGMAWAVQTWDGCYAVPWCCMAGADIQAKDKKLVISVSRQVVMLLVSAHSLRRRLFS